MESNGINTRSACFMCSKLEDTEEYQMHECPIYVMHMDNVHLESRKVCVQCKIGMDRIENYVEKNQLQYCNYQFRSIVVESLEKVYLAEIAASIGLRESEGKHRRHSQNSLIRNHNFQKRPIDSPNRTYISYTLNEIRKNNLDHMKTLPKTLQLMIYLSGLQYKSNKHQSTKLTFTTAQQRHEKVGNILAYAVKYLSTSLEELQQVTIIVNCLLCHMDALVVYKVLTELSHLSLQRGLTWRSLLIGKHHLGNLAVEKLWMRLQLLLACRGLSDDQFETVWQEMWSISSQLTLEGYKQELMKLMGHIGQTYKEKYWSRHELDELYARKSQKNNYELILHFIEVEEEKMRKSISQMEHHHKLEKEEFISKIVKLNNIIEVLEKQLEVSSKNGVSFNNAQTNKIDKTGSNAQIENKQTVQQLFLPSQCKFVQTNEQNKDALTQIIEEQLTYLQSLGTCTNLFSLNERLYCYIDSTKKSVRESFTTSSRIDLSITPAQLCDKMIREINELQKNCQKLLHKIKLIEEEKTRLLGILSRKQTRFVQLIYEKDETISRYENALWMMENGVEVTEEPLSHRINYIIAKFRAKQNDKDKMFDSPGPSTSKNGKMKANTEKRIKAKENDRKDCLIY